MLDYINKLCAPYTAEKECAQTETHTQTSSGVRIGFPWNGCGSRKFRLYSCEILTVFHAELGKFSDIKNIEIFERNPHQIPLLLLVARRNRVYPQKLILGPEFHFNSSSTPPLPSLYCVRQECYWHRKSGKKIHILFLAFFVVGNLMRHQPNTRGWVVYLRELDPVQTSFPKSSSALSRISRFNRSAFLNFFYHVFDHIKCLSSICHKFQ